MKQDQFLEVIDRDQAERRFHAALDLRCLDSERITLGSALHRVLAVDVFAPIDVPGFDRSNVDGFALKATNTFGASEEAARRLQLTSETLSPGRLPQRAVLAGWATAVATGAVIPRGADAVVMVEHSDLVDGALLVKRAVTPGANITFAGTDIGRGETVLRRGEQLTSRETGLLAALGIADVEVIRRPRVAIVSTGNELVAPGGQLHVGQVFDSNATIIADAVRELGGEPDVVGIIPDHEPQLEAVLRKSLGHDMVIMSGGTSKGEGDLSYRVAAKLGPPGIIVHGVALKPGKPLCLAATKRPDGRVIPVVILPGFPTSAIFTFHEFVAPIIQRLGGIDDRNPVVVPARLPMRVNSERGRTEYVLVGLVSASMSDDAAGQLAAKYVAYPMGKGSGSVTTFSRADGYVVIGRQREYLEEGSIVEVHLLDENVRPADLVVIGSHCVGLDFLLGELRRQGFASKFLAVGSTAGLAAARRGECDLSGIHLFDPKTGVYNRPFVTDDLLLIPGYARLQGIVHRPGDQRFESKSSVEARDSILTAPDCVMVNRNRGSGTRVLIDGLLGAYRPDGYLVEARSHNAVAAAVEQGRADWGVAIATVAHQSQLGFIGLQEERYDFVTPGGSRTKPAVRAFIHLLVQPAIRTELRKRGFII